MDRGAWWAAAHRVSQSWTWPKQLSTHITIQVILFDSINKQILFFSNSRKGREREEEVEGVLWVARVESGASQERGRFLWSCGRGDPIIAKRFPDSVDNTDHFFLKKQCNCQKLQTQMLWRFLVEIALTKGSSHQQIQEKFLQAIGIVNQQ